MPFVLVDHEKKQRSGVLRALSELLPKLLMKEFSGVTDPKQVRIRFNEMSEHDRNRQPVEIRIETGYAPDTAPERTACAGRIVDAIMATLNQPCAVFLVKAQGGYAETK